MNEKDKKAYNNLCEAYSVDRMNSAIAWYQVDEGYIELSNRPDGKPRIRIDVNSGYLDINKINVELWDGWKKLPHNCEYAPTEQEHCEGDWKAYGEKHDALRKALSGKCNKH